MESELQMIPRGLYELAIKGEKSVVEWKKSWSEKKEIREAMLAFSNFRGGYVFVGIDEKKKKEGVIEADWVGVTSPSITQVKLNIRQWADRSYFPPIKANIDFYQHNSVRIDVIHVDESDEKPVCDGRGLYRIRTTDGARALYPSDLRELILGKENYRIALMSELKHNQSRLNYIETMYNNTGGAVTNDTFQLSSIKSVLSNGHLSAYFDFDLLRVILHLLTMIEKCIDRVFVGGNNIPTKTYADQMMEFLPIAKSIISDILKRLQ